VANLNDMKIMFLFLSFVLVACSGAPTSTISIDDKEPFHVDAGAANAPDVVDAGTVPDASMQDASRVTGWSCTSTIDGGVYVEGGNPWCQCVKDDAGTSPPGSCVSNSGSVQFCCITNGVGLSQPETECECWIGSTSNECGLRSGHPPVGNMGFSYSCP
jgi:hypothetical protein